MNDEAALDLLADLRAVGLALTPDGDGLCVCPRSKLTEARRQAIVDHKHELLVALQAERMAIEAITRVACRTHPPSPLRQAATPGQPPDPRGLLRRAPRGQM